MWGCKGVWKGGCRLILLPRRDHSKYVTMRSLLVQFDVTFVRTAAVGSYKHHIKPTVIE